ncbi:hypothetical protein I3760_09G161400 [Carya illinoinensis]|nr:hypothetical protein I3760_09G161400 [Carya illinoinensis]
MEEEQQALRVENDGRSYLELRQPITFTFPFTRYATRLIAADHHRSILLGDYSEPRSDGLQGEDDQNLGGYYYYYYSKPILVLDLVWNLAFLVVAVVVLLSTFKERPSTPLRVWLCGYSLQCVLHVTFVYLEYLKRISSLNGRVRAAAHLPLSSSLTYGSILKRVESINTMISSIWWVFGFYWIVMGGQVLLQDSPRLYWLTVVFLAFDVFFIIFCIGMAFVIFFALCCCIPIVAFAYAMTIREGASEDDIRSLPKYRFRQANPLGFDKEKMKVARARVQSASSNHVNELCLHPEDSECCICLSRYVDGVELYTLPCNHQFHCGCISRWLRINATCPLCKFNILRGDTLV